MCWRNWVLRLLSVRGAVADFERADKEAFGRLQCESQLSLRGDLRVSAQSSMSG
jgi:hypothetical protein